MYGYVYFLEYEYFKRFVRINDDNFAYMQNIGKQLTQTFENSPFLPKTEQIRKTKVFADNDI